MPTHWPNEMYAVPFVLHSVESPKGLDESLHKAARRTSGTFPMFPAHNSK